MWVLLLLPEEGGTASLQVFQSDLFRPRHATQLGLLQCCMQHLTGLNQYLSREERNLAFIFCLLKRIPYKSVATKYFLGRKYVDRFVCAKNN